MDDQYSIIQTVLNYIEGWYGADKNRMGKALHAKLAKRRITPAGEAWEVNKEWMVEATGEGKGKIPNPESGRREVTILDRTNSMASVKAISETFIDYLHLSNVGGNWVIVNALWDYLTPE
jgi:hypothetical protein